MLKLPARKDAVATEKAPAGFHKVKLLAESVAEDGEVRTRRVTATIPTAGAEVTGMRVNFETAGAAAVHDIVFGLGPRLGAVEEQSHAGDSLEELQDRVEELEEQLSDMKFEHAQNMKASQDLVLQLEEENESLKEAAEEADYELSQLRKQASALVSELEEEKEQLRESQEEMEYDFKELHKSTLMQVEVLENEIAALKAAGGGAPPAE